MIITIYREYEHVSWSGSKSPLQQIAKFSLIKSSYKKV